MSFSLLLLSKIERKKKEKYNMINELFFVKLLVESKVLYVTYVYINIFYLLYKRKQFTSSALSMPSLFHKHTHTHAHTATERRIFKVTFKCILRDTLLPHLIHILYTKSTDVFFGPHCEEEWYNDSMKSRRGRYQPLLQALHCPT